MQQLVEFVLDDDQRVAAPACEPLQHSEEVGRRARIEVGRRLVEHEDARTQSQSGRDSHTLLLATRQGVGPAATERSQSHRGQRGVHGGLDLDRRRQHILEAEGHLVFDRERAELRLGILKDQADLTREPVHRMVGAHQPGDGHRAGEPRLDHVGDQAVQTQRQCALARSAGTQHEDGFSRLDGQVDVAQNDERPFRVPDRDTFQNHGRRRFGVLRPRVRQSVRDSAQRDPSAMGARCSFDMARPDSAPVRSRTSASTFETRPPRMAPLTATMTTPPRMAALVY